MIKEQHRERISDILRLKVINLNDLMMLSKSNSKTGGVHCSSALRLIGPP
jgi:hypothetical protein